MKVRAYQIVPRLDKEKKAGKSLENAYGSGGMQTVDASIYEKVFDGELRSDLLETLEGEIEHYYQFELEDFSLGRSDVIEKDGLFFYDNGAEFIEVKFDPALVHGHYDGVIF